MQALAQVRALVNAAPVANAVELRPHRAGDIGWIVSRHGQFYAETHNLGPKFEAKVAEIGASFLLSADPSCERCWIPDRAGERLGSVMLVREADQPQTARLRVLFLEPAARGLGLGRRLVETCIGFAREAGYRRIVLQTFAELTEARRLYEQTGFQLARSYDLHQFGRDMTEEEWVLELSPAP
jgi:GNAT superfamily N-acetyltransferase